MSWCSRTRLRSYCKYRMDAEPTLATYGNLLTCVTTLGCLAYRSFTQTLICPQMSRHLRTRSNGEQTETDILVISRYFQCPTAEYAFDNAAQALNRSVLSALLQCWRRKKRNVFRVRRAWIVSDSSEAWEGYNTARLRVLLCLSAEAVVRWRDVPQQRWSIQSTPNRFLLHQHKIV